MFQIKKGKKYIYKLILEKIYYYLEYNIEVFSDFYFLFVTKGFKKQNKKLPDM